MLWGGMFMELVIFRVNGQPYGMKIDYLEGIEAIENVTPVANAPANIIGIANIRGEVVPVLDLAARFGTRCIAERPQYLLIRINGEPMCFRVDSVDGMKVYASEELMVVPKIVIGAKTKYISSAIKTDTDELGLVIMPEKIVSGDEQQTIAEFVSGMQ